MGSVSDVVDIFRYKAIPYAPKNIISSYVYDKEYEYLTWEELKHKKLQKLAPDYTTNPIPTGIWDFPIPKIEVNGEELWYMVEAPKSVYGQFMPPLRLPIACKLGDPVKRSVEPTLQADDISLQQRFRIYPVEESTAPLAGKLQFNSNFECGNLERVDLITTGCQDESLADEYELYLTPDASRGGNEFWFFFRVTGMKKHQRYRMILRNYSLRLALFQDGFRPVAFR